MQSGRKQRFTSWAEPGQYTCKRPLYDPSKDVERDCGKPVPQGDLTWSALDSRTGSHLALCAECRAERYEMEEYWARAEVGRAELKGKSERLPGEILLNHSSARDILLEAARKITARGPVTDEALLEAVEEWLGPAARQATEKMWREQHRLMPVTEAPKKLST